MKHGEEFVGDVSDETRLGILTYTDSQYNYVWSTHLGTLELRYPLNPQLAFQPGEIVRFVQLKDGRGPQVVHDLVKEKDIKLEVIREPASLGTTAWKVKVKMVFAPPTNAHLRRMKELDEVNYVTGLAFTDNFLEVISFVQLDVVPGVVYEGYVTRLPEQFINLGKRLGSLFCIKHKKNTPFNAIVTDQKTIDALLERCPFAAELPGSANDDDIGLPTTVPTVSRQLTSNNNDTHNQHTAGVAAAIRDHQVLDDDDHFLRDDISDMNYADSLVEREEGASMLGLIVCKADVYAVIWSPTHDLVRIQLASGAADSPPQQCSIATWVKYRCFEEQSKLLSGVRCNYTAYDISVVSHNDRIIRTCPTDFGTEVCMQCFLTEPKSFNAQLFHAYDSFAGSIICPHDRRLKELLQNGETVRVLAIFTDAYVRHRWIAFAVEKQDDVYEELEGLPPVIDAKVKPFFNRMGGRRMHQMDEQVHLSNVGAARFKPPNNWTGPKQCGNTVTSVLGVVISAAEPQSELCVIATAFGIARQPVNWELGTWVVATIEAESDEQALQNLTYRNFMHDHTYRVLYSHKISPPMSTRVVVKDGSEKLLLCGDVKCIEATLRNEYLGYVVDPKPHIVARPQGQSFLVELGIARQPENTRNCFWKVLKPHGKSVKNVHCVPLQLSIHPTEEGNTCDDAHRILIDQKFDAKEHKWESNTRHVNAYEPVARRPLAQQQHDNRNNDDACHRLHNYLTPASKGAAISARSSTSSSSSLASGTKTSCPRAKQQSSQYRQWVEPPLQQDTTSSNFNNNNVEAAASSTSSAAALARQLQQQQLHDEKQSREQQWPRQPPNGSSAGGIYNDDKRSATTTAPPTARVKATTNFDTDGSGEDDAVLAELERYQPSAEKKRQAPAIVVRKRPQYLLMYNLKYGLSIVLPKYAGVQSACEFDEKFTLGKFYMCSFVRVDEPKARGLTYEWMCKGDFVLNQKQMNTRLILGRYVHVNVTCHFTKDKLAKLHGDNYILETDLGHVRMSKEFMQSNDLFGKTADVWLAFVKQTEGCHWEIALDGWGSFMDQPPELTDRLLLDYDVIDPVQPTEQQQPEQSVVVKRPEPLQNKLYRQVGYVDFLFGSEVPDGMGGERYQSQRFGMHNDSDEDVNSDDEPIENWDDSLSSTGDEFDDIGRPGDDCVFDAADNFESNLRIVGGATPPPSI